MATIDLEALTVEVVETPVDELLAALDEQCRELLGITGQEFMRAIREGEEIEHPSAARLAILARTLIER